jgi:hypothetical protein
VKPWKFKPLVCVSRQWRGVAQGLGPFYSEPLLHNRAVTMRFYLFTLAPISLNSYFFRGSARLSSRQKSAWAVHGSSEAHYSPYKKLFVSSAHLESGTTLTDEGLQLENMAFRSVFAMAGVGRQFWARSVKGFTERAVIILWRR